MHARPPATAPRLGSRAALHAGRRRCPSCCAAGASRRASEGLDIRARRGWACASASSRRRVDATALGGAGDGVLADGVVKALVGTRALLGEGWDAPCVNVLVDLSAATTSVSVHSDARTVAPPRPGRPGEDRLELGHLCVASGLARGDADYRRFVRKHLHPSPRARTVSSRRTVTRAPRAFAVCSPAAAEFNEINRSMVRRAREHRQAREPGRSASRISARSIETLVVRPEQEQRAYGP